MDTGRRPPNCRKPALERLARHSLFGRYMKAQRGFSLQSEVTRAKLGRLEESRHLVVLTFGGSH